MDTRLESIDIDPTYAGVCVVQLGCTTRRTKNKPHASVRSPYLRLMVPSLPMDPSVSGFVARSSCVPRLEPEKNLPSTINAKDLFGDTHGK